MLRTKSRLVGVNVECSFSALVACADRSALTSIRDAGIASVDIVECSLRTLRDVHE
jgi:cytidine deaminase